MSSNVRVFFDPELRARLARRGSTAAPQTADDLRADNQRLRDEITRLGAEITRLRGEIAQLRGAAPGSSAQPAAVSTAPPADPPLDDSSLRFALLELDD